MLAYLDTLTGFAVVMLGISLIITILTQIVSAALSYRGANLRWGLQTLFEQIGSARFETLTAQAGQLAESVLTHPLASDSLFSSFRGSNRLIKRLKLASAVRADELVAILSHISHSPSHAGTNLAADIDSLLSAQNPTAVRQINLLTDTSPALKNTPIKDAVPLMQQTVNTIRDSAGDLEAWFQTMMDRVSQRFAMQMRIWTIVFACIIAVATGLDSVSLISDLYNHGALRDKLVGAAPQVLAIAGTVLPAGSKTAGEAVQQTMSGVYTEALKKALVDAKTTPATTPANISSEAAARTWIDVNLAPQARQAASTAFGARLTEAIRALIEQRAKDGAKVVSILNDAGFDALHLHFPANPAALPGIAVTAGLLSLGAPFWFNLLKSLTNLRPVPAAKQKQEEAAKQKA